MTLISIASSIAIVLGFAGTLPHIRTMVLSRSSNGQSPTGWLIGILVNVMTGYVNLAGLGAVMLGVGNVIAGSFAAVALFCVIHYRRLRAPTAAPAEAERPTPARSRPCTSCRPASSTAIKALIDEEHARRESFRVARLEPVVDADVAERAFADLGDQVAVAA